MAISAYVQSKEQLKIYIKERLGYPVVNIEVTDTQIEHIINETLEKFIEFAEGGIQMRVMTLAVTAGTQEYQLPFDVYAVVNMFDREDFNLGTTIFEDDSKTPSIEFHPLFNQLYKVDLLTIELSRQMLESINFMMKVKILYDFNGATRKLYLIDSPDESYTAGIVYYQRPDYSDNNSLLYDQTWIKRYSVALTKRQWAGNLLKYTGTPLPAGVQLNAEGILNEANADIEKLDQELEEVWRLPADFLIG